MSPFAALHTCRSRNSSILQTACLLVCLCIQIQLVLAKEFSICLGDTTYEYPLSSCPGGIQLRNVDQWFSNSRSQACVCGRGSLLQFDGEGTPWHEMIYPPQYPQSMVPFLGSWVDYFLGSECELLQGSKESALFIDSRKYEDPHNLPTIATELKVTAYGHRKLLGGYTIKVQRGLSTSTTSVEYLLRTIILNTLNPILLQPYIPESPRRVCAYHPDQPQVVLSKYGTTLWGDGLPTFCKKSLLFPKYNRTKLRCPSIVACSAKRLTTEGETANGNLESYVPLLQTMGEVSVRMKFAEQHINFTVENWEDAPTDNAHMAMLTRSSRIFFRGFPEVVKWETLMNALTVFGVAFDGLMPGNVPWNLYQSIRIALGRCAVEQERKRVSNMLLYNLTCTQNKTENGGRNKLVELLWKMVQFTQVACFPSTDYHPNLHHFYAQAMIDLFALPAVQLLWNPKPEHVKPMEAAMRHIFPELPDNVLPAIDMILKNMEASVHFNHLRRPTIQDMDKRDMRCAGNGKLIWEGKACCYLEAEDKQFRYLNRVAFAKM